METFLVVFGLLATCFALSKIVPGLRVRAMRSLAARRGFQYIGGPLPASFRMTSYPADDLRFVRNVIEGQSNGMPILIFDCDVGVVGIARGRTCTFIATQTDTNPFGSLGWGERIVQSSGWSALYRLPPLFPSRPWTMGIRRIEDHLDSLRMCERAH